MERDTSRVPSMDVPITKQPNGARLDSAHGAKSTSQLDRLPAELTEIIATYIERSDANWRETGFFALRLSCKELYAKTFRYFGETYFCELSVVFNPASLDRLSDLALYKNMFGLTLAQFPTTLAISTYRLLSGNQVDGLIVAADKPTCPTVKAMVAGIGRACKLGIDRYHSSKRPPVGSGRSKIDRYMVAVMAQRMMEHEEVDVSYLASSLVRFPNLIALSAFNGALAWGQDDWQAIAGIDNRSFLEQHHAIGGRTNMTVSLSKMMSAIAQANSTKRELGTPVRLESLHLMQESLHQKLNTMAHYAPGFQAHRMFLPQDEAALVDSLSNLKTMSIGLHAARQPGPGETATKAAHRLFRVLFSSKSLEVIKIVFNDQRSKGTISCGRELVGLLAAQANFPCIRCLELKGRGAMLLRTKGSIASISRLIASHAMTLQRVVVDSSTCLSPRDCLPVLAAAARCELLEYFELRVAFYDAGYKRMGAINLVWEGKTDMQDDLSEVSMILESCDW